MLKIGDKIKIKQEAWQEYCNHVGLNCINLGELRITSVRLENNVYYYMSRPVDAWWLEEHLELVKPKIIFEDAKSVKIKNHSIKVGDTLRCTCRYKVTHIYPVLDKNTGQHLIDDPRNSFSYDFIRGCSCLIHHGRAFQ